MCRGGFTPPKPNVVAELQIGHQRRISAWSAEAQLPLSSITPNHQNNPSLTPCAACATAPPPIPHRPPPPPDSPPASPPFNFFFLPHHAIFIFPVISSSPSSPTRSA